MIMKLFSLDWLAVQSPLARVLRLVAVGKHHFFGKYGLVEFSHRTCSVPFPCDPEPMGFRSAFAISTPKLTVASLTCRHVESFRRPLDFQLEKIYRIKKCILDGCPRAPPMLMSSGC